MRPFKMFFGLAIGLMVFLFLARVVFAALVIAAIMSIVYAIYRRLKDFITFDRYGEYYIPSKKEGYRYEYPKMNSYKKDNVEPLFYDGRVSHRKPTIDKIKFIETL